MRRDATGSLIIEAEARRLIQELEQLHWLMGYALHRRQWDRAMRYRRLWAATWAAWNVLVMDE